LGKRKVISESYIKLRLPEESEVLGRAEDTVFCEACADIVFFGMVLHDFSDPAKVLRNAGRMLKADGRLVDLDWKKEPMELGPPTGIRFSEEEAIRRIEAARFRTEAVKDSGSLSGYRQKTGEYLSLVSLVGIRLLFNYR